MMRYIWFVILFLFSLAVEGQSKKIGDIIVNPDGSRGVVFWLNPKGTGGWMVAMKDLSSAVTWGAEKVNIPGLVDLGNAGFQTLNKASQDTLGYENTKKIRNVQGNGNSYTAQIVDFKNGWYIPAIGQLRRLFAMATTINPILVANGGTMLRYVGEDDFIDKMYYSSSEADDEYAWGCLFSNGQIGTILKSERLYSRAIRSFSYSKTEYDPDLTYKWSGGQNTPAITDIPAHTQNYEVSVESSVGCRNTAVKQVFVAETDNTTIYDVICKGETYQKHGFNVSVAGNYSRVLKGDNNCDITLNLILAVNDPVKTEFHETICEGEIYTQHNFTAWETGIYTQTWTAKNGCDSIVSLHLRVNPIKRSFFDEVICEGAVYNEHGFYATEAGSYEQKLKSAAGCDSIVTLALKVNPVYNDTIHAVIVSGENYAANGFNESVTGVYTHASLTSAGCDSLFTLVLNVEPERIDTVRASICRGDTYKEYGFNESETGTYTRHYQNASGNDCVATLILTVNPVYNRIIPAVLCKGETYLDNGFTESTGGTYVRNLHTVNGCDSILTLILTVNPVYNDTIEAAICQGDTYIANGFQESVTGVYTHYFQSQGGCDSIVTLKLTVNPIYHLELIKNICEGDSFDFFGTLLTAEGVYRHTFTTIDGCDSVFQLKLNVNHPTDTLIEAAICRGDTYRENGFEEMEAGEYVQHLQTHMLCDSIVRLKLSVEEPFEGEISVGLEQCETHTYLFKTEGYNEQWGMLPWRWNFGDGSFGVEREIEHSYINSGRYQVSLTVGRACERVVEYIVNVPDYPDEIKIYADRIEVDSKNPEVHLWTDRYPDMLYNWDMDDGTVFSDNEVRHIYNLKREFYDVRLTVTNPENCSQQKIARIWAFEEVIPPNTFSPNGDGVNDIFMKGFRIRIVDRNGMEIFNGSDGWDGTYKGKQVLQDTYFYEFYISNARGEEVRMGYVTVVR